MSEQMIPLSAIRPPAWNSRLTTEDSIEGLATSMSTEGQINAVTVEGPDDTGMFDLVTGSRRMRAAASLNWTEIRANVEPTTDVATRIIRNVIENQQRKDLTLYEQARACSKLREEKLKLKEIVASTGLSETYISNLVAMYNSLPTIVLKGWEDKNEAATFTFLRDLTTDVKQAKTPQAGAEVAIAKWTERVELVKDFNESLEAAPESEEEEETADEKKKKKKAANGTVFKGSMEVYDNLAAALKKARLPGTPLALQAIKVLVGELDKIKGVYPLSVEPTTKGK